ncbi:uncharacterized protein METZ01_LOCUS406775 [marine metagenome]|uniref:Uncharacterized protein n=1 Tax=marine metagenome TaxID=408172 RepID=A0A382W746_9ZZZZ
MAAINEIGKPLFSLLFFHWMLTFQKSKLN